MENETRNLLSVSTLIGDTIENLQGEKLFAVPWQKLHVDQQRKCIILNASKEQLKDLPGFDKDHWPDMTDPNWQSQISSYYQKW